MDRLSSVTTEKVTALLDKWMLSFGYPVNIRTDGGPQFRGPFVSWCASKGITHELLSLYHPESNGHAEQGVKTAKHLLTKVDGNMERFRQNLFAWRNTPRLDGFAPTDLFFGRRQRSTLPTLKTDVNTALPHTREKLASDAKVRHDARSSELSLLSPGDAVSMQDPATGKWGEEGIVVSARREDGRSYVIETTSGSTIVRGRKMLRPNKVAT